MAKKFLRIKFIVWSLLLVVLASLYYVFWLNTVSIINQSGHKLEDVKIYNPFRPDKILWEGSLSTQGTKYLLVPRGTSDSKLVLEVIWQGKLISGKQWYPAIGPGKFHFRVSNTGQIYSNATNILDIFE